MTLTCRKPWQAFGFAFLLVASSALLHPCVQVSFAETPEAAISRIQAGRHTPMPAPTTAPASGAEGKGLTVENNTGYTLHVYFSGPASRTVVVPDRRSESVELAVGSYQVAAEVPDSPIVPFYGRQAYEPFTHYWLQFYAQRVDPAPQRPSAATSTPGPANDAAEVKVITNTGDEIVIRNAFMDYTPSGPLGIVYQDIERKGITAIQSGGTVTVRWDRIAEVRITGSKTRVVMAEIALRDGRKVAVRLRSGRLVGETELGTWQIDIGEVKTIAPMKPN